MSQRSHKPNFTWQVISLTLGHVLSLILGLPPTSRSTTTHESCKHSQSMSSFPAPPQLVLLLPDSEKEVRDVPPCVKKNFSQIGRLLEIGPRTFLQHGFCSGPSGRTPIPEAGSRNHLWHHLFHLHTQPGGLRACGSDCASICPLCPPS